MFCFGGWEVWVGGIKSTRDIASGLEKGPGVIQVVKMIWSEPILGLRRSVLLKTHQVTSGDVILYLSGVLSGCIHLILALESGILFTSFLFIIFLYAMKLCEANLRHIVGKCEAWNDSWWFTEFLLPLSLKFGVLQHGEGKALVAQCLGSTTTTHSSLMDVAFC